MKNIKVPVHVNLPLKTLQRIDETAANRSGFLNRAALRLLDGDGGTIEDASTRQLMAALSSRPDVDHTLRLLLVAMLMDS